MSGPSKGKKRKLFQDVDTLPPDAVYTDDIDDDLGYDPYLTLEEDVIED